MLRVVVIGYGEMFANLIAGALDANVQIAGVFRHEMIKFHPIIRRLKDIFNPSLEYNYIKSYNLQEIDAGSVNSKEFKTKLLKLNPDIILVGSWSEKISKEIYDLPKIATINAHPSLLPKYRGPNPYFWTIKNGESVSGVTFHLIDGGFDTGAILAQEEIKIYPSDTGKTLKERTVLAARGVVCELLKDLREDIIIPLSQREDKATYYSHPDGLEIDFNHDAEEISALIRACRPWNNAYFYDNDICLYAYPPIEIQDLNDDEVDDFVCGKIIESDYKTKTISVTCGNKKIIKFKITHSSKIDRPFTCNYIKYELLPGKILS